MMCLQHADRGYSPMRNAAPPDQYQQMLDEKRREEASRRYLQVQSVVLVHLQTFAAIICAYK